MATGGNKTKTHTYEESCEECNDVEKEYVRRNNVPNVFLVHAQRQLITGSGKDKEVKKGKKRILQDIEKKVSALRNTHGGHLLVHVDGHKEGDRYLEYFHEFVDKTLQDLVECGKSYTDSYVCTWLYVLNGFELFPDVLLITVENTCCISTVNFNTKICNDFEKLNASTWNIVSLLAYSQDRKTVEATLRGLDTYNHECRNIEVKFLPDKRDKSDLVEYIWDGLKLKDNLTSLSKVDGGGSYYVGLAERCETEDGYKKKVIENIGFEIDNPENFKKEILDKIQNNVCVLHRSGDFGDLPPNLIKIETYNISVSPTRYILEVAVGYFSGLVFSDKKGPRTYEIFQGRIRRMDRQKWLRRIQKLPPWKGINTKSAEKRRRGYRYTPY